MLFKLICLLVTLNVVSGLKLSCEESWRNDKNNLSMELNSSSCEITEDQTTTNFSCSRSFEFVHLVCDRWPLIKECGKNSRRLLSMKTNYHVDLLLSVNLEKSRDQNVDEDFLIVKLEKIKIKIQPLEKIQLASAGTVGKKIFGDIVLNLIRRNQVLYFDASFDYQGPSLRTKKGHTDPCVRSLRVSELPTWTEMILAMSKTDKDTSLSRDLKVKSISLRVVKIKGRKKNQIRLDNWISTLKAPSLRSVNASNSGIVLYRDTLAGQRQLTHLYLSYCGIKTLNEDDFKNLQNLRVLDLSKNEITEWIFTKKFPTLQELNLSGQKIRKAFFYKVSNFASLKSLNLSHIHLSQVDFETLLFKMHRLETLDLRHCNLTDIPENLFSSLTSLKYLILDHNEMSVISPSTFLHLPSKVSISLKYNNLTSLQNMIVNQISILDLSNNQIENIENIIENGTIETLILKSNNIKFWKSKTVFNSNKHIINNVNLQHNKIQYINANMTSSMDNLTLLDIGGNPFYCQDCSLLDFQKFLNSRKISVLNFGDDDVTTIKCESPVKMFGSPVLSAEYNDACRVIVVNYLLTVGLPVVIITLLIILIMWLVYFYRFEITHIRHLLNVRRKNKGEEKEGCTYDVFVSYSSKDRDWVMDVLLPGLENPEDRYCLCLHERDFRLGTYIVDNIVSCIDQSRRVLFVLSRSFVDSEWCRWELRMAQHRIFEECRDSLVLLELERLDRATLPLHLRVLMDSRTYLEWPSNQGDLRSFWVRLKEGLGTPLDLSRTRVDVELEEDEQEGEDVC